jgi:hypothetical protein
MSPIVGQKARVRRDITNRRQYAGVLGRVVGVFGTVVELDLPGAPNSQLFLTPEVEFLGPPAAPSDRQGARQPGKSN